MMEQMHAGNRKTYTIHPENNNWYKADPNNDAHEEEASWTTRQQQEEPSKKLFSALYIRMTPVKGFDGNFF